MVSCKKTSSPVELADNYNSVLFKYFNGTRFTLSNNFYQLYSGGKSYISGVDTTKNGLTKSLAFTIRKTDSLECDVYSINPACDKINPAYMPDSTVRIPMNISVQNVGSAKDGYYLGMKFVDLITAENEGIGFSANSSTYKYYVPQIYYKLIDFKFDQLSDGTNQLQITLASPNAPNLYLDLLLRNRF